VNKWRHRPATKAAEKAPDRDDRLTDDAAVAGAAEDIYDVASKHREGVKAKDAVKKTRKKSARRG
jgi:hypothetical protein